MSVCKRTQYIVTADSTHNNKKSPVPFSHEYIVGSVDETIVELVKVATNIERLVHGHSIITS